MSLLLRPRWTVLIVSSFGWSEGLRENMRRIFSRWRDCIIGARWKGGASYRCARSSNMHQSELTSSVRVRGRRDRECHDIGRYCTIGERAGLLFGEMALVMMIDSHLGCCSHDVRTYRWTGAARHDNSVLLGDRRASQALVRPDGGTARRRGGNGGNHHRNINGGGSLLSCSSNSNWGTILPPRANPDESRQVL